MKGQDEEMIPYLDEDSRRRDGLMPVKRTTGSRWGGGGRHFSATAWSRTHWCLSESS